MSALDIFNYVTIDHLAGWLKCYFSKEKSTFIFSCFLINMYILNAALPLNKLYNFWMFSKKALHNFWTPERCKLSALQGK